MIKGRKVIFAFVAGLILASFVRADMVGYCQLGARSGQVERAASQRRLGHRGLPYSYTSPAVVGLELWSAEFSPEVFIGAGAEMTQPLSLGQGPVVSVCLSALLGLSLCSSPHWVRKLSFGRIPQYYHEGGPLQIVHSFAVSPQLICPVPACCFARPVRVTEPLMPEHRQRTVVSLWRRSQFTPDIIAPRGPPCIS